MPKNINADSLLISIVTVCYNSSRTICRTIDSVLNQTYENYEYIIIDGGSTDGTIDIIKKYEKKANGKMCYISEPDKGIYDAMNKGIYMAKGTLIGLINSDDFYEKDALAKIVNAYSGGEMEIVYGTQRDFTTTGILKDIVFYSHEFLESQMINHPTCFVTRKTYENLGVFDLTYKASSDYDFLLRAKKSENVIFTPVFEVISNFTLGGESSSMKAHLETFKIWKKYKCITKKRYILITISTIVKNWLK